MRATLERVGAGWDTAGKLAADGGDPEEILLRLSELYVVRGELSTARKYHELACSVAGGIEKHNLDERIARVGAMVSK